jgi:hypothetical protein
MLIRAGLLSPEFGYARPVSGLHDRLRIGR